MKLIGVLYGGKTGEHAVSCRSAASVVSKLDRRLFEPVLIGIDGEGVWYLQEGPAFVGSGADARLDLRRDGEKIVSAVPGRGLSVGGRKLELDFVFPVLHGTFGEDGTIQGLLELIELPYAGAGVLGSAVGMDKVIAKRLWEQAGLPVVPYILVTRSELSEGLTPMSELAERAAEELSFPLFVKPVCAGSSVGVSRVGDPSELQAAIDLAFRFDTRLLLERSIDGREVECSVVGNGSPRAFAPGEIVPSASFYDYEAKYVDPDGAELIVPARLEEARLNEIRGLALDAFRACGATGMARVDFLLDADGGTPYLNEINTIPGFTSISMFSRLCEAEGVSYQQLLTTLIELGFEQFRERRALEYSYRPDALESAERGD